MKVFVMPTSYPNEDNPVANIFVKEQVACIKQQGCETIVLNVQKQPTKKLFTKINMNITVDDDNVSTVYRIKQKTILEKKMPILNQILFAKSMKKLFFKAVQQNGKPDIIYAHFYKAAAVAISLGKKMGIPVVVMEHSGEIMGKMGFSDKMILKYAVSNASKYICTTDKLKQNVMKQIGIGSKITVIPNVVDSNFSFHPRNDKCQFVYFALARLEYDKRIDLLIDAFCKVFRKEDKVQLRIGGIGSEFENITKKISELGRECQIIMLSQLSRERVQDEMINCDCFALASRHETFGLVWREAMCMGRPVITTNHGGFGDSDWTENYGKMIEVDNLNQLCESLLYIFNNYNSYDLKQISLENVERYSMNTIGIQVYNLFLACIGESI